MKEEEETKKEKKNEKIGKGTVFGTEKNIIISERTMIVQLISRIYTTMIILSIFSLLFLFFLEIFKLYSNSNSFVGCIDTGFCHRLRIVLLQHIFELIFYLFFYFVVGSFSPSIALTSFALTHEMRSFFSLFIFIFFFFHEMRMFQIVVNLCSINDADMIQFFSVFFFSLSMIQSISGNQFERNKR